MYLHFDIAILTSCIMFSFAWLSLPFFCLCVLLLVRPGWLSPFDWVFVWNQRQIGWCNYRTSEWEEEQSVTALRCDRSWTWKQPDLHRHKQPYHIHVLPYLACWESPDKSPLTIDGQWWGIGKSKNGPRDHILPGWPDTGSPGCGRISRIFRTM